MASCTECERLKRDVLEASIEQGNAETAVLNFSPRFGVARDGESSTVQRLQSRLQAARIANGTAQARLAEHMCRCVAETNREER